MRAFGTFIKKFARRSEGKVLPAFLSGLTIAALLQSSTATILIAASFSGQGLINVWTAFMTVLGADVGTAIAVLVASQKLTIIPPLLLTIGVFGFISSDSNKHQNIFRAISGLGMILLSLSMISATAAHLSESGEVKQFLEIFANKPLFFITFAVILTYLAHSSLAIVLLATSFVLAGMVGLEAGLYLVLGANLGSGLLPLLSNWKAEKAARIPVLSNMLVRCLSVLAFYPIVAYSSNLAPTLISIELFPALFHLLLNISVAIFGIAFAKLILQTSETLLPNNPISEEEFGPKFLEKNEISKPAISLAYAKREALHMAEITQKMVFSSLEVMQHNDQDLRLQIRETDDQVDELYEEIKLYIARVMQDHLTEEESNLALYILSFTTTLEHIGDIIDCSLMDIAARKIEQQIQFSNAGLSEITAMHEAICANYELAINTFISGDAELGKALFETKKAMRKLEKRSVATHIQRIGEGVPDSLVTSSMHLDVIRDFKRINSLLSSVAYPVLIASGEIPKTHWKRKKQ
jgi:phosphate:Na+ symporter